MVNKGDALILFMADTLYLLFTITVLLLSGCISQQPLQEGQKHETVPDATTPQGSVQASSTQSGTNSVSSPGRPDLGANSDLNGYRPFPDDNPWNQDISSLSVDPDSDLIITTIGEHPLHPDFGTVWNGMPIGIPYIVVSGNEQKTSVSFEYAGESDRVPYPILQNPPIEGGSKSTGDRHVLIIDRDNLMLYELYAAYPNPDGSWKAGSGAVYNLSTNELRPARWTSADAAGLPIFPGLVRYDEVALRREINHAIRFTIPKTRKAFVCPARHYASTLTDKQYPPMGARFRLKADYDISGFSLNEQVILKALKKYGMILADNGSPLFISGAPDTRWNDEELGTLKKVRTSDFEVVLMPKATGPEGEVVAC
jgi:hypothetical protein